MTLTLYNTLTRRKEPFETLEAGKVKMYCCGVTVYDYCHLGHARAYIVWDTVRRYLLWRGYDVRYVQNFTDIDDKILNRARETNSTMEAVAERFIEEYFIDMDRLNVMRADEYPRATHSLDGIKRLIHELEHQGYAYPSAGDVYYTVRQFPEYGKLSGKRLDDLQAGASGRVDTEDTEAPKKKDPFDFALWKAAKPGEPAWESPWGQGRPGWHIECSAMVRDRLGDTIDIHCGGEDLQFPHHENEIAQSEAATGKPLARYWMHNGFINVDGEKMAKSVGNFTTIRQFLDAPNGLAPMALRLFILQAHYRKPIDFTPDAIASAKNSWNTLLEGLLFAKDCGERLGWTSTDADCTNREDLDADAVEKFQNAMDDDFNSPAGLAVLFELAKELRRARNVLVHQGEINTDTQILERQWRTLVCLARVLGFRFDPSKFVSLSFTGNLDTSAIHVEVEVDRVGIESLVKQRQEALQASNSEQAANLTKELQDKGIILIDHDGKTLWLVKADIDTKEIQDLIEQRNAARKVRNFAEADRIRNDLKLKGINLIDRPNGETEWIVNTNAKEIQALIDQADGETLWHLT